MNYKNKFIKNSLNATISMVYICSLAIIYLSFISSEIFNDHKDLIDDRIEPYFLLLLKSCCIICHVVYSRDLSYFHYDRDGFKPPAFVFFELLPVPDYIVVIISYICYLNLSLVFALASSGTFDPSAFLTVITLPLFIAQVFYKKSCL